MGLIAGAEVTDNIIVLNSQDAVNTFITNGNVAIGGEASMAVGPWGRTGESSPQSQYVNGSSRSVATAGHSLT